MNFISNNSIKNNQSYKMSDLPVIIMILYIVIKSLHKTKETKMSTKLKVFSKTVIIGVALSTLLQAQNSNGGGGQ